MNCAGKRLAWLLVLVWGVAPAAWSQVWPVAGAPWRVRVERVAETPWPAKMGVVQICPGNLDPAKCQSYVVGTNGSVVGSRVLWAASGEPATVLFDTASGSDAYYIYLSSTALPATPAWEPPTGVLVETRGKPPGPVESWAQMRAWWAKATSVQGRSVLAQLYQGLNPHGPAQEFMAYYRAQLRVEEAGEYALATVSGDASFLLVDGELVAQWPGSHGPGPGRHGRYSGRVRLAAGLHVLEYYHAVGGSEPLAEVAWRRPGKERFEVVPARAFGTVAQFAATGWEGAPWNPAGLYVEWSVREHATAQGWPVVTMQFRVPGVESNRTCRWTFDDNSTATGAVVEHVFARTGMRSVKVEVAGRTLTTAVQVRPNWRQLEEWPAETARRQNEALRGRVPALPATDLAALVPYATALGDRALLRDLAAACWKRPQDFSAEQASLFYLLGQHCADPTVREFDHAERAYRMVLGFTNAEVRVRAQAALRLAELLAGRLGRAEEAGALVSALPAERLTWEENRLRQILLADAALARGEVDAARRGYAAVAPTKEAREEVRRRARLEGAQALLARGNWDDAELTLTQALWQDPLEKLNLETGMAWLRLCLARREWAAARQQCVMLLNLATGESERAQLLYHLAEIEFALGRAEAGWVAVKKLVQDYPYTEAAARAKDKWPVNR